ncbi:protein kinase [Polyangium sp. rjm3]|uniref:Protein kinase n=2 Tax=Polyangium mundeleinium TaxID=2995306 RepID=A0ABT5F2Y6_9BACT|nr:protein kinase [Polyangium mundeleinium]
MFPSEPVPERIGAYKVLRRLSGAGSADVYVGRMEGPMGFSRLCTLKLVRNTIEGDAHFAEELVREAAICAVLNHPSIQRMFDFFEHDKHLVLVLEHVEGVTLDRLQDLLGRQKSRFDDRTIAFLGRALSGALAHAHAAKDEEGTPTPVIHRTMHPENVLIGWDGHVRLTGFGLGKILGRSPDTVAFVIKGAPGFMAPEQARGERVTPKADVYGLAVLLWSLYAGAKPPEVGTRPMPLAVLRSDLPKELTSAIDGALEPSPDKRKVSCQDLERVLNKAQGIELGQKDLEEKVAPLKGPRTKATEVDGGPRKRVPLESVRPAKPPPSSKQRLSVPPPSRPPGSIPPVRLSERPADPGDAAPASVYPLLRALAERVPGPPRLPLAVVEADADVQPEAPTVRPAQAQAQARGPSKPSIAAPLGAVVPEGEWKESVPDEELFDQLFDDATSRSGISLTAMGIGAEEREKAALAITEPDQVTARKDRGTPPPPQGTPGAGKVMPPPAKLMTGPEKVVPSTPKIGSGVDKVIPGPSRITSGAGKFTPIPPPLTPGAGKVTPVPPPLKPGAGKGDASPVDFGLGAPKDVPPPFDFRSGAPKDVPPTLPEVLDPAAASKVGNKRLELADTVMALKTAPSPGAPPAALPAFAPPPMPPAATKPPALAPPPMPPIAAPPVPPRFGTPTATPALAAVSAPVVPAAPAAVSAAGSTADPVVTAAQPVSRKKRPPPIALAIAGGAVALITAGAVVLLTSGSDPNANPNAGASASSSAKPSLASPETGPTETAVASPSTAPAAPPAGYGLLTVAFPSEGNVYVSGKKLGHTNEAFQAPCGSKFVRVSSSAEGKYPEWLSAGETVVVPCQESLRIDVVPGRPAPQVPRKKKR